MEFWHRLENWSCSPIILDMHLTSLNLPILTGLLSLFSTNSQAIVYKTQLPLLISSLTRDQGNCGGVHHHVQKNYYLL